MFERQNLLRFSFIFMGLFIAYQGIFGIKKKFSLTENPSSIIQAEKVSELESIMTTVSSHLDPELKSQIEDHLMDLLDRSPIGEKHKLIKFLSLLDIDHGKLDDYIIQILKSSSQEDLIPLSLKHLSKRKNKWLHLNIHIYLSHYSEFVRLVALQSLLDLCPNNANYIFDTFYAKEKNLQLKKYAKKIKEELDLCTIKNYSTDPNGTKL